LRFVLREREEDLVESKDHMRFFLLLFLIWSSVAVAQSKNVRPANDSDFTGYWRVVLIPNDVHRSRFKNEVTNGDVPRLKK